MPADAIVGISTVADGSLYDNADPGGEATIAPRERWLANYGIGLDDGVRLRVNYTRDDFCRYREVGEAERGQGMRGGPGVPASDAFVTRTRGLALFLPIADCIGTAILDPDHEVLMLSHLGRHSLVQDGAYRSVRHLVEHYDADPARLRLWTTGAPGKHAYPIHALGGAGMKESLWAQLARAGVAREQVVDDAADTATDPAYFSHSAWLKGAKPAAGRFAMVAMLRP